MSKTVHLILNAHIDPIWLWPWTAGLDCAIATCRSACDRLDAHPDIFFSRGEAWIYHQIELTDPPLFDRIRAHIESGQWHIVGGWWIQPDCNLPLGFAMRKQIELGKSYFEKTFGQFPRVAYNVDSFGHAASLPNIMNDFGQSRYVMMRPDSNEHPLPARLFRWRGFDGGPQVTTFRIAAAYCTRDSDASSHIRASLTELPEGVGHTMCFIGVGDHGGGPTESQIAWLKSHRDAFDGWRLEFSTPERFFDAVAPFNDLLPLVTGELQHHAVGCYSVHRSIKTALRRAEHLVAQAEIVSKPDSPQSIALAWRDVCFHAFHDTLGGTAIPSAYLQANDQLGRAAAFADETLHYAFRRRLSSVPGDKLQRMALWNASDSPFSGYVTLNPWLENQNLAPEVKILDEAGNAIDYQLVSAEALVHQSLKAAVLMSVDLAPGQLCFYRIDWKGADPKSGVEPTQSAPAIERLDRVSEADLSFPSGNLSTPHLELLDDPSDTWSHGVTRFSNQPEQVSRLQTPTTIANGPLLSAAIGDGVIGASAYRAQWRIYRDDPFIELRLSVQFVEKNKMLKLVIPLPSSTGKRTDGIMEGSLVRDNDGMERPFRDWTCIDCSDGKQLGIVAPDCFAMDCDGHTVRLSLLRSPLMAHHDPYIPERWRGVHSDQGCHEFRFWFIYADVVPQTLLESRAHTAHRPPLFADVTRGMPTLTDSPTV